MRSKGKIGIIGFTERGRRLAERIMEELCREEYQALTREGPLREWCRECFDTAEGIIFIGACGIAVRTIAPFLKSKTQDPAVLVIDEAGNFVISLLSGHIGGANELAVRVAEWIGAVPVITTASDVNGKIAVDVFAKKNHLAIGSMQAAREIAAAILRGQRVGVYCTGQIQGDVPPELILLSRERFEGQVDHLIWISEYLPDKQRIEKLLCGSEGTVLHLIPKNVFLGVGCRRGKPEEEIQAVFERVLEQSGICAAAVCAAGSIDLKKEEAGILGMCRKYGIPFYTYPAEELARVQGDFRPSEFVKKTTGVDNVCERAALRTAEDGARRGTAEADRGKVRSGLAEDGAHGTNAKEDCGKTGSRSGKDIRESAGRHGKARLVYRKYAENGVTAALAAREWSVRFEE